MGKFKKIQCEICNYDISSNAFARHKRSCTGKQPNFSKTLNFPNLLKKNGKAQCPYCMTWFKSLGITSHILSAHFDKSHTKGYVGWNAGLTKETDERVLKSAKTLKAGYDSGRIKPPPVSPEYRALRSEIAKRTGFGGYRKNAGRSKKYHVNDSFGNKVCLQSSYELICSQILDKLQIKWLRPPHLLYGNRRYYPDFYLTEHDVYLDPKNPYLMIKDKEKINTVIQENNVIVLLLSKNDLTEQYFREKFLRKD